MQIPRVSPKASARTNPSIQHQIQNICEGKVFAVESVLKVFEDNPGKTLLLPGNVKEAKHKILAVIQENQGKSPAEIIPLIVKEFGFKEDKEKKEAMKEKAMSAVSKNPKNGPIATAFQEMSALISKAGDRNRAGAYIRAAEAVNGVEYEITTENAMGMSKGKATKVKNIGKGTAEKIHEFLSTGKIEKLEELRANAE